MHASCTRDMNEYNSTHGEKMGLGGTIGDLHDHEVDLTAGDELIDDGAHCEHDPDPDDDDDDEVHGLAVEEDD